MLMKLLGDDPARWREVVPDFDYEPSVPDEGSDGGKNGRTDHEAEEPPAAFPDGRIHDEKDTEKS